MQFTEVFEPLEAVTSARCAVSSEALTSPAELLPLSKYSVRPLSVISAALEAPAVHDFDLMSARTLAALDASMLHVAALIARSMSAALEASMLQELALTEVSILAALEALTSRSAPFSSTSLPRISAALEALRARNVRP